VGKTAEVKGTFYSKVYPFSRLDHWHHQGWRPWETALPDFARVFRIEADSVDFGEPREFREIQETPLSPYVSPVVDLNHMEFEAASMGTGKKCLEAGENTPEHSSGRYHELLLAIEGELTVRMENVDKEVKLSPGNACYVPSNTKHSVANTGGEKACYVFVYSLPG
jgi:quercetin dioxygenase-like cupin family protein